MKKMLTIILSLIMVMLLVMSAMADTYTGEAEGKNDKITVEITVNDGKITDVQVTGQVETVGIADQPLAQIPAFVVDNQSLAVDAFTGATVTRDALVAAIGMAAAQAGLDVDALKAAKVETEAAAEPAEDTADVVVIGAGGAGLAAAAGAAQSGASVIVLEANGMVGGATIRSGGNMLLFDDEINAAMERNDKALEKYLSMDPAGYGEWGEILTTLQAQVKAYLESDQVGRLDTVEMALIDHIIKGSGKNLDGEEATNDYSLLVPAFYGVNDINAWLKEGGMQIQSQGTTAHGGKPAGGVSSLISTLQKMAEDNGARIVLNMRGTELLVTDGTVSGVVAVDSEGNTHTYHANNGVIIATGGFQSNPEMVMKYQRIGTGIGLNNASTSPKTLVGDGIVMAEALGAKLRDMSFICTVMEGYHEGCSLGEFGNINKASQLSVNQNGVRFADDTKNGGTAIAGAASLNQPDGLVYYMGDAKMLETLGDEFVNTMTARGDWFVVRDTLEEAAKAIGLDADAVKTTVETFNGYVDAGEDPDFGRKNFNGKMETGPFCIVKCEAHYHLTFGGLVINPEAQVLDENDAAIPGLYAAGDVLSGLEGVTHQSRDCISTMLFYGRVAGQNAAARK